MPTSCKLLKPNSRYWHLFHDLFLKEEKEYTYQTIEQEDGSKLNLNFYVRPDSAENRIRCDCGIDTPFYAYSREKGRVIAKSTADIYLRVFELEFGNVLALFAPKWLAQRVTYAMTEIAKSRDSSILRESQGSEFITPVILKIHSKEKQLQSKFIDVRRLWLKDIPDPNLKGAALGGIMLQDTPEYEKYVRRMGGRIEAIAFKWNGVTILMSANGSLFTYAGFDDIEATNFFKEVIDALAKIGVISG